MRPALNTPASRETPASPSSEMKWLSGEGAGEEYDAADQAEKVKPTKQGELPRAVDPFHRQPPRGGSPDFYNIFRLMELE